MNRLYQLKQTLIQNIADSADYAELEFIVLDYNSKDDMEEWIKQNLTEHINSGRLIYYKTSEPESWSPSHSKNIAFKLATGDILCNIWADYFIGTGFVQYVNESFKADNNIVLTPIDFHKTKKNYAPPGDVLGKVCVKKSDFLRINGFDERMNKHGFEDYDFVNRLEMAGLKRVLIENFEFLKYLKHDDTERYTLPIDNLKGLYLSFYSPSRTDMLFLYKDYRFQKGSFIDNSAVNSNDSSSAFITTPKNPRYSLMPKQWQCGKWENNADGIGFYPVNGDEFCLNKHSIDDDNMLFDSSNSTNYYKVEDKNKVSAALKFEHFYDTQYIMEENLERKTLLVNNGKFGRATVYKNFTDKPISVNDI